MYYLIFTKRNKKTKCKKAPDIAFYQAMSGCGNQRRIFMGGAFGRKIRKIVFVSDFYIMNFLYLPAKRTVYQMILDFPSFYPGMTAVLQSLGL